MRDSRPIEGRYRLEYLAECLSYNSETGQLSWKERPRSHFRTNRGWACFNSRDAGKACGGVGLNGYRYIRLDQIALLAHRVAWVLGRQSEIPCGMFIDHINGDRADNQLANLRLATKSQNGFNSRGQTRSSLPKGVSFSKARQKYIGHITAFGRRTSRRFETMQEAVDFVTSIRADWHGIFANGGTK